MEWIIDDWLSGKVELVTSALTIAEVLWVRCEPDQVRNLISRDEEDRIRALFDQDDAVRFMLVEVSRTTARRARDLVWDYGIKPKDAIHVAAALEAHCPVMHTNDAGLWNKHVGGTPALVIPAPSWIYEPKMPLGAEDGPPPN
jgi:predicted nucleic acid-binding protein